MTLEEELAFLRAENQELKHYIAELEKRLAELEQDNGPPPSFVKASRSKSKEPNKPRRKRAPHHNQGRHREEPTRTIQHALDRCPDCHYQLRGQSLDYARQVIELPPPQRVEVIEHQVIKRFCPCCQRWRSPKLNLGGQVLGQGRMGVGLVSLIAYLRNTLRLPISHIQTYLHRIHQLRISRGEVVELLHQARRASQEALEDLRRQMRGSGVLHADETGWREDGQNGYIWSFSTPGEEGIRYYEYDHSRSQEVVKRILANKFGGHLVSDFYGGYNDYAGAHQRCWIHMLGDLHDLKEANSQDREVVSWAEGVRALYDEAEGWLETTRGPTNELTESGSREVKYVELVGRVRQLGLKYAQVKKHPCQALAKRILRHEDELFQFVVVEGLSANNNLAERSIRPMVVIRKTSGGSRSDEGTKTRMGLASLFETWQVRGLNPFEECLKLLSHQTVPST